MRKLGIKYGILAGISSFIFQLPVQLLFFECHAAEEKERTTIHANNDDNHLQVYQMDDGDMTDATTPIPIQDTTPDIEDQSQSAADNGQASNSQPKEDVLSSSDNDHTEWWYLVHAENLSNASLWWKIANRVIRNPVVLGKSSGTFNTMQLHHFRQHSTHQGEH